MTSIWKDAPHHVTSWKSKLRQQGDITMYLLEWENSRTLTSNAGHNVEQNELAFIAAANSLCRNWQCVKN